MDTLEFAREHFPHMPVVGVDKVPVAVAKTNNVRWRITDYWGGSKPTVSETYIRACIEEIRNDGRIDGYSIRRFLIEGESYMSELFDINSGELIRRDVVRSNR